MNKMAPPYLCNKFCDRASIHDRHTRNRNQLQIPLYTSASGQRTFKYRAVKIWNSLDSELKEMKSLKNFKFMIKSKLLEKHFN